MFAVLAAFALVMGWVYRARQQRELKARVTKSNPSATLLYDHQVGSDGRLAATPEEPGPRWLRERAGIDYLANIAGVELFYPTNADLQHVARLPRLRRLYLARAVDVTDAGLAHLTGLTRLKLLVLEDADQVTDAGLDAIGRIKSLEILELVPGRQMTPAGIGRLKRALPHCTIRIQGDTANPPLVLAQAAA
jgi:hypothetical protein